MIDINSKLNHPVNNRCARMLEKMGRVPDPRTIASIDLMMTHLEEGTHPLVYPRQVELQKDLLMELVDVPPETALKVLGLAGDEVALTQAQAKALNPQELARHLIWALHLRMLQDHPEYPET